MAKKTATKIRFGNKLREIRKQAGISQEKLGFKAGLHRTYIGSIERGEQSISVDNVYKLAKALRVKPRVLFDS